MFSAKFLEGSFFDGCCLPKSKKILLVDSESQSCCEVTRENKVKPGLFGIRCSEFPNKNIRVSPDESVVLVNDFNKLRVKLMKDGRPSESEIKFDDYYKFHLIVEDFEMLDNDLFLTALSDGSLNLH